MAVDVLTEVVIDRPPERVAAFAGDPSNPPEWYVNIKSVEWQTPPPLSIGSRLAFVAHFLGRHTPTRSSSWTPVGVTAGPG